MLSKTLSVAPCYAPVRSRHEVILYSQAIVVDEFTEVDLTCNGDVEERVGLHLWRERLRVLVVLIHVFVFELVGIVFIVGLFVNFRVLPTHVVHVYESVPFKLLRHSINLDLNLQFLY